MCSIVDGTDMGQTHEGFKRRGGRGELVKVHVLAERTCPSKWTIKNATCVNKVMQRCSDYNMACLIP